MNPSSATHGFVELPGARLAYESAGQGEPVVFLHGGLLDRRMWDDQFAAFVQEYHAIRFDMRGAGQTTTTPTNAPYYPYQDLYQVLQALALAPATLVGLSGGARWAIDCAIAHPKAVRKLVLVSPGMSGYEFRDPWTQQRGAAFQQALGRGQLDDAVEVFLTMWVDGPNRSPVQIDAQARERARAMATQALALGRDLAQFQELDPPAASRLAEIEAPALIVLGDQDTSDIFAIGALLRDQVAQAEYVMLPDVGHALVMEQPQLFNTILDRFLRT